VLQRLHLGQAASVSLGPAEASGQKSFDQLQGERRSDHLSAETKDIHVVVFDALTGKKVIMDLSGAHPRNLVRGDGGTNAAAAQRHAALDFARGDGPGQGDDEVRVVILGVQSTRAKVRDVIARVAQGLLQFAL